MQSMNYPFPATQNEDMGSYKFTGAAPGSASGEFVTWEQFLVALDQIIGVRWNTASSSPILEQVDAYGTVIAQKTHAWFDAHLIYGNMWRCTLTAAGVPTFGANARGDGLDLTGASGNVMVRIPKCYVKAQLIGTYQYVWVSPVEFTGFEVHPWFLQRGGTERSEAYMGAYLGCLKVDTTTGVKSLISKSGGQPFTGGEIVEVNFDSGSVEPQIGEVLTGATSLMTGTVEGYYVTSGTFGAGNAAGKVYLRMVSRRFTFDTGSHEPVVGETITGVSSGATGKVSKVVVTSGSWGTSDAAGYILLEGGSGNGSAFTVGQNFRDPDSNVIGKSQSIGETLGEFTIGGAFDGTPACPLASGSYESSIAAPPAYNVGTNPDDYAKTTLYEDLTKYLLIPNLGGGSSSTYLCDYMWWHRSGQVNILLAGGGWDFGASCGVGYRSLNNAGSLSGRAFSSRLEYV